MCTYSAPAGTTSERTCHSFEPQTVSGRRRFEHDHRERPRRIPEAQSPPADHSTRCARSRAQRLACQARNYRGCARPGPFPSGWWTPRQCRPTHLRASSSSASSRARNLRPPARCDHHLRDVQLEMSAHPVPFATRALREVRVLSDIGVHAVCAAMSPHNSATRPLTRPAAQRVTRPRAVSRLAQF